MKVKQLRRTRSVQEGFQFVDTRIDVRLAGTRSLHPSDVQYDTLVGAACWLPLHVTTMKSVACSSLRLGLHLGLPRRACSPLGMLARFIFHEKMLMQTT